MYICFIYIYICQPNLIRYIKKTVVCNYSRKFKISSTYSTCLPTTQSYHQCLPITQSYHQCLPNQYVILSGGKNPVSPKVSSWTCPLGQICTQVTLALYADRFNHAADGNCRALQYRQWHYNGILNFVMKNHGRLLQI